jgi:prepilin-type processing-associated H-X9-DG protein/prepilin-type N-terminal cleavage/methylation domain-containing protein
LKKNRKSSDAVFSTSKGFTLIEMLVVLGISGILLTLTVGAVHHVRESAQRTKCASNLRNMITAATACAEENNGRFPWASRRVKGYKSWCWDFVIPSGGKPQPGVMWSGHGLNSVLQCPSFIDGRANWEEDPFTGYNYNCSFIGKVEGDPAVRQIPASLAQIENPARTAVFGDGQYGDGANKFMRAPKADRDNDFSNKYVRESGTQGFRHGGKANIAFADGHVEALAQPYQYGGAQGFVTPGCGFISEDNSLYSLKK